MDNIATLSQSKRQEIFSETARAMNVTNAIVEKDFWVVWVLDKIFAHEKLGKIFMFKGGTSLSKVFNLIGRFSEDIDLVLDWREVTKENPKVQMPSKNKQVKFNNQINENAQIYIRDTLMPLIEEILAPTCKCKLDKDNPYNINITYPASFKDEYLRNEILLEIGPLASWTPSEGFEISSYASQKFPDIFSKPTCKINAILAKRTFWEKVTILHQEANRLSDKNLPLRYSRHYYDVAIMAKSSIKKEALNDLQLLAEVVEFKNKFYPASWAKFDEAKSGTLKLLPPDFRMQELKKDYKAMENMIFDKFLSFEEILQTLQDLENEINLQGLQNECKPNRKPS